MYELRVGRKATAIYCKKDDFVFSTLLFSAVVGNNRASYKNIKLNVIRQFIYITYSYLAS